MTSQLAALMMTVSLMSFHCIATRFKTVTAAVYHRNTSAPPMRIAIGPVQIINVKVFAHEPPMKENAFCKKTAFGKIQRENVSPYFLAATN
jgi:hypothetical protein